jgi:hypothetical protein
MPLSSTGPISFANLQTEFGGSNPISLSEYYAGGDYVNTGVFGKNGFIPASSAELPISRFYGSFTPRAIFAGGNTDSVAGNSVGTIDFSIFSTGGTAASFGSLTQVRTWPSSGVASSTRAVFAGGRNSNSGVLYSTIDYVTILTIANAAGFGSLTDTRFGVTGASSSTRGIFAGGQNSAANVSAIDYITIATTSNAAGFGGVLTSARRNQGSGASSTRAVFAGGFSGIIDYVTIATTGNAAAFGNLTLGRVFLTGGSSSTRAVFGGGDSSNTIALIDYVTIATTGNAAAFGNLNSPRVSMAGAASATKVLFAGGGSLSFVYTNVVEQVTITTAANSTSFGNLSQVRLGPAGASSNHGGLY